MILIIFLYFALPRRRSFRAKKLSRRYCIGWSFRARKMLKVRLFV